MRIAPLAILVAASACAPAPTIVAAGENSYVYRLGAGDHLKIVTYGEDKMTGEFVVDGEGSVSFPLVGEVPAKGRTVADFRADLVTRLAREYLRNPNVIVEVANFRPVFVLGEVTKPGEFTYAERMTVYSLVAQAGGFTYRANQKIVFIRHEDETRELAYALTSDMVVRPGDTVRVAAQYF